MRPKLFIASSKESLDIAYSIQENLDYDAECTVWNQGIFEPTKGNLENLENALSKYDFGVFVFTPNDIIKIKGEEKAITRDNIIFELGLFIGKLSRERCFMICPMERSSFYIPSDLLGITTLDYNTNRNDKNLTAALGPACNKIRGIIQSLGKHISTNNADNGKLVGSPIAIEIGIRQVIEKIENALHRGAQKVFTNYYDLDELTTGFANGSLIITAGVPSVGITSFLINTILNITENYSNRTCLFVSDSSTDQVIQRMMSIQSAVPNNSLELGKFSAKQGAQVSRIVTSLSKKPITIYHNPTFSLVNLIEEIRNMKNKQDIRVVVIDNLEKVRLNDIAYNKNESEILTQKLATLQTLAQELDVVILCGFKLDSNEIHSIYKYPIIAKAHSPIINIADIVLLLHRPFLYGITMTETEENTENYAEINIAKNKYGNTKTIKLAFSSETMTFKNYCENISDHIVHEKQR